MNPLLEHVPLKQERIDDARPHSETESESSDNIEKPGKGNLFENCGSVLILNRKKLFLICKFCDTKYANLEQFAVHLNKSHYLFTHEATAPSRVTSSEEKEPTNSTNVDLSIVKTEPGTTLEEVRKSKNNDENAPPPMVSLPTEVISSGSSTNGDFSESSRLSFNSEDGDVSNNILHESNNILQESKKSNRKQPSRRSRNLSSSPKRAKLSPAPSDTSSTASSTTNQPIRATRSSSKSSFGDEKEGEENLASLEIPLLVKESITPDSSRGSTPVQDDISSTSSTSPKDGELNESGDMQSEKHKPLHCQFCNKIFFKNSRLQEHLRVHTGEKPFKCDMCGKGFRLNMRLKDHLRRHNDKKEFSCSICGLQVNCRQDLVLHQKHHVGDKRYKCEYCDKAFVRSTDLKIHTRIHTNEKPYKCEICGLAFRANQNLIMHRTKHTKEKQLKCDFCDKKFHRNVDRKVHHRTHTGEKPFKCEICGKQYSAKVHVRSHIEREHTGKSDNVQASKRKKGGDSDKNEPPVDTQEQQIQFTVIIEDPNPDELNNFSISTVSKPMITRN